MKTNVYHITYSPKFKTACLYFEGCNFRCLGCIRRKCNFDVHLSVFLQKETDKKRKRFLAIEQILNVLKQEKVKKAIFMGGEPTIDPKFSFLVKRLKERLDSYNILLTNGYILPEPSFLDEICVGIKARTPSLHREYTGKDLKTVFKNLKVLNKSNVVLRTESMFIPDYIGLEETERIANSISRINPNILHRIDAYIPVPATEWRRPNLSEIKQAVKVAKKYLKEVSYIKINKKKNSRLKILI